MEIAMTIGFLSKFQWIIISNKNFPGNLKDTSSCVIMTDINGDNWESLWSYYSERAT